MMPIALPELRANSSALPASCVALVVHRRVSVRVFAVLASVISTICACGGVVGPRTELCDEPVASFCAAQAGGCPERDGFCDWGRRRGTPTLFGGGPIECPSGLAGYAVTIGDDDLVFLFRADHLERVYRRSRDAGHARCVAGPNVASVEDCEEFMVGYACGVRLGDAGAD